MLKLQSVLLFCMTTVQISMGGTDCPGCGLQPVTFRYGSNEVPQKFLNDLETTPKVTGATGLNKPDSRGNTHAGNNSSITRKILRKESQYRKIPGGSEDDYQYDPKSDSEVQSDPTSKYQPGDQLDKSAQNNNSTQQEFFGSVGGKCIGGNCKSCKSCQKCKKNACDMPIVPEICKRQFTACNDDIHFYADINLMFKEKGFWCKLKNLVRQAVEDGLDDRCELCRYNYVETYVKK